MGAITVIFLIRYNSNIKFDIIVRRHCEPTPPTAPTAPTDDRLSDDAEAVNLIT